MIFITNLFQKTQLKGIYIKFYEGRVRYSKYQKFLSVQVLVIQSTGSRVSTTLVLVLDRVPDRLGFRVRKVRRVLSPSVVDPQKESRLPYFQKGPSLVVLDFRQEIQGKS